MILLVPARIVSYEISIEVPSTKSLSKLCTRGQSSSPLLNCSFGSEDEKSHNTQYKRTNQTSELENTTAKYKTSLKIQNAINTSRTKISTKDKQCENGERKGLQKLKNLSRNSRFQRFVNNFRYFLTIRLTFDIFSI